MLSKRIIACLDVRDGRVVKGVNFEGLRDGGRSGGARAALQRRRHRRARRSSTSPRRSKARRALAATIRAVSRELFIPLAVGGGIRTEADAAAAVDAGADKVEPEHRGARRSGADHAARGTLRQPGGRRRHRRQAARTAASRSSRAAAAHRRGRDAVEWAREAEARGAGEILLTSIDRDGTRAGFDCELTAAVSTAVSIPVIASGGAGTFDHFVDVFTRRPRRRRARRVDLPLRRARGRGAEASPARQRGIPVTMLIPSIDLQGGRSSSSCRASGSRSRPTMSTRGCDGSRLSRRCS